MSPPAKDPLPPPYTPSYTPSSQSSRGQSILDQLTLTRAHHIHSIITTHIMPLVEQQASYGIAHTTIAMLPSDIPLAALPEKSEFSFDTTTPTQAVEVIGFSSEEAPKIVRLEGQMNRTEFWRPQAVIEELERVLRETLNASSRLRSPASPVRGGGTGVDGGQAPRRGFLTRLVDSMGPEQRSPGGNPEVGGKQVESVGLVLVKARLEEICLRTVTEFGLYDTLSRQCVIIRVDARC
ncbi:hypothetical protein J1614_011301 [Plenodomus biglobosus]|nr:hypothetical protein J1614_011301 [Plenodomus biglobosus]